MLERCPPLRAWRRKRRDGSVVEMLALDAQPDVNSPDLIYYFVREWLSDDSTQIHQRKHIADAAACYQEAFQRVLARLKPGQLSLFGEGGELETVVEVLGFDAKVHYRRAANHPLVLEALSTPGYSVRGSTAAWLVIQAAICESNVSFDMPVKIRHGKFLAGPVGVSPENQLDFYKRLSTENDCGELVI